jgi:hypothetical protein
MAARKQKGDRQGPGRRYREPPGHILVAYFLYLEPTKESFKHLPK